MFKPIKDEELEDRIKSFMARHEVRATTDEIEDITRRDDTSMRGYRSVFAS